MQLTHFLFIFYFLDGLMDLALEHSPLQSWVIRHTLIFQIISKISSSYPADKVCVRVRVSLFGLCFESSFFAVCSHLEKYHVKENGLLNTFFCCSNVTKAVAPIDCPCLRFYIRIAFHFVSLPKNGRALR